VVASLAKRKNKMRDNPRILTYVFLVVALASAAAVIIAAVIISRAGSPVLSSTPLPGATQQAASATAREWTSTPSPTATVTDTPTATPSRTPRCPYESNTDFETFVQIIRAEERALLEKDISIIQEIYAPDAVMHDVGNNQEWTNVVEQYQHMIKEQDFQRHEHTDFALLGNNGEQAWVTSGIRGSFVITSTNAVVEYENPSPSDHFTFNKNNSGCWVLTKVDYNALNQPFPP
jgi:hypothetical protein